VSDDRLPAASRRALLVAGLGGLVAAVAAAIGRPLPARAADGEFLKLGNANTASSPTTLAYGGAGDGLTVSGGAAAVNAITGTSGDNVGSGIRGVGDPGSYAAGVWGSSDVGVGVRADTTTGDAVWAKSTADGSRAVYAQGPDTGGYAIYAEAGEDVLYAQSTDDGAGAGDGTAVTAYSQHGVGIFAVNNATNAPAVLVESSYHTGVAAYYGDRPLVPGVPRTAIVAGAQPDGFAFRAQGRVTFSTAGLAMIPGGSRTVTVTPGVDISGTTKVLATLQSNPGGTTAIQRVQKSTTTDRFTIYLTANATGNTSVAWFLIS
jgi:hypothetical protein